jgi:hypothetical protein
MYVSHFFKEAMSANTTMSIHATCTDDHENIYFDMVYIKFKAMATTISSCTLPTSSSGMKLWSETSEVCINGLR